MNHLLRIITISFIVFGCSEKFDRTEDSANLIIDALSRYQQHHGFFPEHLKDLTPSYLKKIPKSSYYDREFIYEKYGDSYQLTYLGAYGVQATYHSTNKKWTYDD